MYNLKIILKGGAEDTTINLVVDEAEKNSVADRYYQYLSVRTDERNFGHSIEGHTATEIGAGLGHKTEVVIDFRSVLVIVVTER